MLLKLGVSKAVLGECTVAIVDSVTVEKLLVLNAASVSKSILPKVSVFFVILYSACFAWTAFL